MVLTLGTPCFEDTAFFVWAFVCSSNIHWAVNEMLLLALGCVLGLRGYRAHSECLSCVTHLAKCFACASSLNPHSNLPLLLTPPELWPCPITLVWLGTLSVMERQWALKADCSWFKSQGPHWNTCHICLNSHL